MKPKLPFEIRKKQFYALSLLGIFIVIFQLSYLVYKEKQETKFPEIHFTNSNEPQLFLTDFDPNQLNEKQWENLGFTAKQVKTILKYKEIVGGNFTSKEQLKKCYSISEEKFAELEPYILLPEDNSKNSKKNFTKFEHKELQIKGKFNPDLYSQKDWKNLGFSEKQAAAIIKYKQYLGGSFVSKEKFKECFIISPENYQKLSPFLLLPEKTPENFERKYQNIASEKPKIQYFEFDPNTLDTNGWQKLGFSEKQATVIVNYRERNLKGSFKSLEDIKKCFVISEEKFNELKPYIKLNLTQKTSENAAQNLPEKAKPTTDFSKTDLNKITFQQLIEFGFDEKSAASFIGFRNKLGGFVKISQILETYNIDKNLAEKLINVSPLNNMNVQKFSLIDAPEDWLKNHPYFRYYANKIIYYRISFPKESTIFEKMKAKPEDEAKMRLYLK